MENSPFHLRLRKAREDRDLNQADLARVVGKSTSAICQLEGGNRNALAAGVVKELCHFLEIDYEPPGDATGGILEEEHDLLAFCSNQKCPAANFDFEDGELIVQPKMYRIWSTTGGSHCIFCQTSLVTGCSNCLTPIVQGAAFCSGCGSPLVEVSQDILGRKDLEGYARRRAARRKRILSGVDDVIEVPRPVEKNSRRSP